MEAQLGNGNSTSMACNITVAMAKDTVAVFAASSALATLCYLASVLLIVKTRAYRQFVHRLALSGLFRAIAFLFQVIPIDVDQPDTNPVSVRAGWEGACVFGGMIVQYVGFVQSMAILWMCLYIFVVVVLRSQKLRQRNHEVIGVVLVVLVPVLFTWEPFVTPSRSYGISGTRCWIKDTTCEENSPTALHLHRHDRRHPAHLAHVLRISADGARPADVGLEGAAEVPSTPALVGDQGHPSAGPLPAAVHACLARQDVRVGG